MKIAEVRRLAQPTGEDWTHRRYRAASIFLSVPLARAGVHANLITITWSVLGALGAVALGFPHYWVRVGGACLLQFSQLLDYVDGEVARLNHETSKCGAFLDCVGHDVIQRCLFLPLGYGLFRATSNVAYLFFAFSAGVFFPSYIMVPFIAEFVELRGQAGDQGSTRTARKIALLRKAVQPFHLLMKQTGPLILAAAILDHLTWILIYYAITAPILFLHRFVRQSQRLKRVR